MFKKATTSNLRLELYFLNLRLIIYMIYLWTFRHPKKVLENFLSQERYIRILI